MLLDTVKVFDFRGEREGREGEGGGGRGGRFLLISYFIQKV